MIAVFFPFVHRS